MRISPIITSDNLPCKSFTRANDSPAAFFALVLRPRLHKYVINPSPSKPPQPWKWPGIKVSIPSSSPTRTSDAIRAKKARLMTAITRRKSRPPSVSWRSSAAALSAPFSAMLCLRQSRCRTNSRMTSSAAKGWSSRTNTCVGSTSRRCITEVLSSLFHALLSKAMC